MGHGRWPPERRLFNSQKIAVNDGSGFKTRYMRAVGFEWAQKPSDPMYKVVQGTRSYAPPAAFEAEPPGGESGITIFMQNVTDVPGFMGYLKSIGYEDQFEVNIYVSDTPVAQDGHSLDEVRIPALSVFTHRLPKGVIHAATWLRKHDDTDLNRGSAFAPYDLRVCRDGAGAVTVR